MEKQTAIRLHVEVASDHTVTLPAEVPVGPAELIVLVHERAGAANAAKSLLGLFASEPEVVDEAMRHVRAHRRSWHIRPAI